MVISTPRARHRRADDEDQRNNPVGVNPQNGGHFAILLHRTAHPPQPGTVDYR